MQRARHGHVGSRHLKCLFAMKVLNNKYVILVVTFKDCSVSESFSHVGDVVRGHWVIKSQRNDLWACYRLHLLRTWGRENGPVSRSLQVLVGFQKWTQIFGWSKSNAAFSLTYMYRSFCSWCSGSKIPIDADITKSNSRGFPPPIRMTSLNIQTFKIRVLTARTDAINLDREVRLY